MCFVELNKDRSHSEVDIISLHAETARNVSPSVNTTIATVVPENIDNIHVTITDNDDEVTTMSLFQASAQNSHNNSAGQLHHNEVTKTKEHQVVTREPEPVRVESYVQLATMLQKLRQMALELKEGPKCTCNGPEEKFPKPSETDKTKVVIGVNGTEISSAILEAGDQRGRRLLRRILEDVFGFDMLATHSMTGRMGPRCPQKPKKDALDPRKVDDIVNFVCKRTKLSRSTVKLTITTKCSDEKKQLLKREQEDEPESIQPPKKAKNSISTQK